MKIELLMISAIATLVCWFFILRSCDPWFVKIPSVIVSAIPVFGPFFYAFAIHSIPPVKPIKDQAKMSHHLTINDTRNYDPVSQDDE